MTFPTLLASHVNTLGRQHFEEYHGNPYSPEISA